MSAQTQPKTWTQEEYLAMEEKSPVKNDFIGGQIYERACGTFNHTTICGNLIVASGNRLSGKACRARSSEQKVKVEKTGDTFTPDAVIFARRRGSRAKATKFC